MIRRIIAGGAIAFMLICGAAAGPAEDGYAAHLRGDLSNKGDVHDELQ
jgi:hypothetical protein